MLRIFLSVISMVAARSRACVLSCFNLLDNKIPLLAYKLISVHGLLGFCCVVLFCFVRFKSGFAEFFRLCHVES